MLKIKLILYRGLDILEQMLFRDKNYIQKCRRRKCNNYCAIYRKNFIVYERTYFNLRKYSFVIIVSLDCLSKCTKKSCINNGGRKVHERENVHRLYDFVRKQVQYNAHRLFGMINLRTCQVNARATADYMTYIQSTRKRKFIAKTSSWRYRIARLFSIEPESNLYRGT